MEAESAALLCGLSVVDLGNSRMKSVSPVPLSKKPMELRSDAVSGVDGPGVVVSSGLEAAAIHPHVSLSLPNTTIPHH
jgi:hypothetical protein